MCSNKPAKCGPSPRPGNYSTPPCGLGFSLLVLPTSVFRQGIQEEPLYLVSQLTCPQKLSYILSQALLENPETNKSFGISWAHLLT